MPDTDIQSRLKDKVKVPARNTVAAKQDVKPSRPKAREGPQTRRVAALPQEAMRTLDDWARSDGSWNISTVLEALANFYGDGDATIRQLLDEAARIADERKEAGKRKRIQAQLDE